jgi:hypothetical protein
LGFFPLVVGLKSANGLRFIPTLIAVCAAVSLYAFTQVDNIVNQALYIYGLRFSLGWANPD